MILALAFASFAAGTLFGSLLTCLMLWPEFMRILAEHRQDLDRIYEKRERAWKGHRGQDHWN